MTIVMRPSCSHQNFGPNGLSAPAQGLCLNFFSSITADFNISSALRWAIQDQWSSGFLSYLNDTRNKSTVNSYNLISNHFHAKLEGKQSWNKANLIWSESARINLPTVKVERIRNVQIEALQTVLHLFSFIVVFFFSYLIQTLLTSRCLQWRKARFCKVLLRHAT